MSADAVALVAHTRQTVGHANRRLTSTHQIPAVVYGKGHDNMPVALDRHDFENFMTHHGATGLVQLKIDGENKAVNAVIRDIQYSVVKGSVLHVDFMAVKMDETIHATVPVHLIGEPEGVRIDGGVLTVNVHEVNIEALPGDLPDVIEYDVEALKVGDSVSIAELAVPKGVKILDDVEAVVASVQGARVEEAEVAAEEAAEPEVIGEKAEEE
jgi:large subunit ribosomal protein L25